VTLVESNRGHVDCRSIGRGSGVGVRSGLLLALTFTLALALRLALGLALLVAFAIRLTILFAPTETSQGLGREYVERIVARSATKCVRKPSVWSKVCRTCTV